MVKFISSAGLRLLISKAVRLPQSLFQKPSFSADAVNLTALSFRPCRLQSFYVLPPFRVSYCALSKHPSLLSTKSQPSKSVYSNEEKPEEDSKKNASIIARFKKAYKVHGKVLIVVHCVTSAAWFGTFYLISYSGLDVVSALKGVDALKHLIEPMLSRGLGTLATALILYKLAMPIRYFSTIAISGVVVNALRARGLAPPLTEEDRLRNLARQGARLSRARFQQSSDRMRMRLKQIQSKRRTKKPL